MISKKEWVAWFVLFGLSVMVSGAFIGIPLSIAIAYITTHNDKERFRSIIGSNKQIMFAGVFVLFAFVIFLII